MTNILHTPQDLQKNYFTEAEGAGLNLKNAKKVPDNISDLKVSNTKAAGDNMHKSTMDFCKLFFASLKHQDPLSPTKIKDMLPQIAQIHVVEQTINTNKLLEKGLDLMSLSSQVSYLGKEVAYKHPGEGTCILKNSNGSCEYEVSGESEGAYIIVKTLDGHRVFFQKMDCNKGWNKFEWDGKDSSGNLLEDNVYKIEVFAKDLKGEQLNVNVLSRGKITGGVPTGDDPSLIVDGNKEVLMKNIVEVFHEEKNPLNMNEVLLKIAEKLGVSSEK
jgi:flagellar basal-body rod modification protein FlgD